MLGPGKTGLATGAQGFALAIDAPMQAAAKTPKQARRA
jgi:hypothetical protein